MPDNKFKRVLHLAEGWIEYYPTLDLCSYNVYGLGCTTLTGDDRAIAIQWLMQYGFWN
jgi:hypothetical protein